MTVNILPLRQYVNMASPNRRSPRLKKRQEKFNLEQSYQQMIANHNPTKYLETPPRKKSGRQSVCFDTDGSIVYEIPQNEVVNETRDGEYNDPYLTQSDFYNEVGQCSEVEATKQQVSPNGFGYLLEATNM